VARARLSLVVGCCAMFIYALLLNSMGVRDLLPAAGPAEGGS
jgi:hypothetical protein